MSTAPYIYTYIHNSLDFGLIFFIIYRWVHENARIIFCLGYNRANKPKHQLVPDGAHKRHI